MFIIMSRHPRYDNRDGICGSVSRQAIPNAYETLALAQRMVGRQYKYDDEGQPVDDEVSYFVADTTDPWRRPVPQPAREVDYADDLPF